MTTQEIKQIIQKQIEQEKEYLSEHSFIWQLLKGKEGKPINYKTFKRKDIELAGFRIVHEFGMTKIKGLHDHLISYNGLVPSLEEFEKYDSCHGKAAVQRIEKLESLDINKIKKHFGNIEKCFNSILESFGDIERDSLGSFNNPIYYALLKFIFPETDPYNKFKLSDLYYLRK